MKKRKNNNQSSRPGFFQKHFWGLSEKLLLTALFAWGLFSILGCCKFADLNPSSANTEPATPIPFTTGSWWKYLVVEGGTYGQPVPFRYNAKYSITGSRVLPNGKTVIVWKYEKSYTTEDTAFYSANRYLLVDGKYFTHYTDSALKTPEPFFSYSFPLLAGPVFSEKDLYSNTEMDSVIISGPGTKIFLGKTYNNVYSVSKKVEKLLPNGRYVLLALNTWRYNMDIVPGLGNISMTEKYELSGASMYNYTNEYTLTEYYINK